MNGSKIDPFAADTFRFVPTCNGQIEPGEDICRIKVWKPRIRKPTALPPLLICSRCGRIPPTMVKDCTLFLALNGKMMAYFLCRIADKKTLELVKEAEDDSW